MTWIVGSVLAAFAIYLAFFRKVEVEDMDPREEELVVDINDPRVPDAIRKHAAQFKTPVHFVIFSGPDIVLSAENGEVIDICSL